MVDKTIIIFEERLFIDSRRSIAFKDVRMFVANKVCSNEQIVL